MAPTSKQGAPITDFTGLFTNNGLLATGEETMASQVQINLVCVAPGELGSRPGLRPVEFDEDSD